VPANWKGNAIQVSDLVGSYAECSVFETTSNNHNVNAGFVSITIA
jgi:hypothetical protein